MSEMQTGLDRTADGDPLVERGSADSARNSVTEPEEEDDENFDDDDEDAEEDEDL